MKLSLKNIGKISSASVELNGITIIAGENNTGKSTVGKALYSVFNSFYNIDKHIESERIQIIYSALRHVSRSLSNRSFYFGTTKRFATVILENADEYSQDVNKLENEIVKQFLKVDSSIVLTPEDRNVISEAAKRIIEVFNVSDDEILKNVVLKQLSVEFERQINNIFTNEPANIDLQIKNESVSIQVVNNNVVNVSKNIDLNTEVIYIDDPFVVDQQDDDFSFSVFGDFQAHKEHLKDKLFSNFTDGNIISEIINTNKLDDIYSKINSVCAGSVVDDKSLGFGYKNDKSDNVLNIKNVSTGLKTFVILKTLLQKGVLDYNGVIVLDEPEIHLHPKWQILFAELIVLIQKDFNMHILLNTHSPYFL